MPISTPLIAAVRAATVVLFILVLPAEIVVAQCATARVTNFTVSQPDAAEKVTIHLGYDFTPATCCPHLKIAVGIWRGAAGTIPVHGWEEQVHDYNGSRTWEFSLACMPPGAYTFVGSASWTSHLCGANDTKSAVATLQPVNSVVMTDLRSVPQSAKLEATVTYNFPTSGPRNVELITSSWMGNDGTLHTTPTLLGTHAPSQASGTWIHQFDPPSNARWVQVRAVSTRCTGFSEAFDVADCPTCSAQAGDPVSMLDGSVTLDESDPLPPMIGSGGLGRRYMSSEGAAGVFGRGWFSMFDRRLVTTPSLSGHAVTLSTANNDLMTFVGPAGGPYTQAVPRSEGSMLTLRYDSALQVYELHDGGDAVVSRYSAAGRFIGWRDLASGRQATITYDPAGSPQSVVDSWSGLTWTITTDATSRRVTSIAVSGTPAIVWDYAYDGTGNLQFVYVNAASWRTYEYVNDLLTAARDPLGNLIESHTYDSFRRATSSIGPSDDITLIEYDVAGAGAGETLTRVTTAAGGITEFILKSQGTIWRPLKTSGGCSSCGARDSAKTYDREGRILREQSADGYISEFTYDRNDGQLAGKREHLKPVGCDPAADVNQCRLSPAHLAVAVLEATSATLTTAFERSDSSWPEKITKVTRPSVAVTGNSIVETHAHDAISGAVTTASVCGWIPGATACDTRTTNTILYGSGLVGLDPAFDPGGTFQTSWLALPQPSSLTKAIDGPRTDVQDITSFVHYPVDASVPAMLRGRLAAQKKLLATSLAMKTMTDSVTRFGSWIRTAWSRSRPLTDWAAC